MDLKDNAAMFLEEMNISGDTMVNMNHDLENLPEHEKGAYNLFDIMAAFVEHVRGDGFCHEEKATLPINIVSNRTCKNCGNRTLVTSTHKGKNQYQCLNSGFQVSDKHSCQEWRIRY